MGKRLCQSNMGEKRETAGIFRTILLSRSGFTLLELLIAMLVGMVVLGAVYSVFTVQNTQFSNQETMTEMQQNARIAMEMMTREIGLAAYRDTTLTMTDPLCLGFGVGSLQNCSGTTPWGTGYCLGFMTAGANLIKFTMDITDSAGANNTPNGTVCNANEVVTYGLYSSAGVQTLGRKTNYNDTSYDPVVENVEAIEFKYYNSAGTELTQPVTALESITNVRITIRVKASKEDPNYTDPTYGDRYRRYELSSFAIPRNLLIAAAATTTTTAATTTTTAATTATTTTTTSTSTTTTTTTTSTTGGSCTLSLSVTACKPNGSNKYAFCKATVSGGTAPHTVTWSVNGTDQGALTHLGGGVYGGTYSDCSVTNGGRSASNYSSSETVNVTVNAAQTGCTSATQTVNVQ